MRASCRRGASVSEAAGARRVAAAMLRRRLDARISSLSPDSGSQPRSPLLAPPRRRGADPPVDRRRPRRPWIERMLAALRLGDTLAARIRAHSVDYTKSKRDVVIELIRDARGPTMRTRRRGARGRSRRARRGPSCSASTPSPTAARLLALGHPLAALREDVRPRGHRELRRHPLPPRGPRLQRPARTQARQRARARRAGRGRRDHERRLPPLRPRRDAARRRDRRFRCARTSTTARARASGRSASRTSRRSPAGRCPRACTR